MKEYIGFISNMNEVCIDETQPIVRCKDCELQDDFKYCDRLGFEVGDCGYCAWPVPKERRTIDDVLELFFAAIGDDLRNDEQIAEYANELRELFRGEVKGND